MKIIFILIIGFCVIIYSQKNPDTLPVELIYFEAHPQEESILIKWGTATEIENFGFEVQRSTDLITFEVLEFIFGHGTSFVTHHYEYVDSPLTSGTFYYRLKQIDTNGDFKITDTINATIVTSVFIEDENKILNHNLSQNFPNPFNPSTTIQFTISNIMLNLSKYDDATLQQAQSNNFVTLKIYDVLGNEVETLVNEAKSPGNYSVQFNGSSLSSGIYYYQLKSNNFTSTKKMILLK